MHMLGMVKMSHARTHKAHGELREVFARGFLVRNQGLGVNSDILYEARSGVDASRPHGWRNLFVHHTYALEIPRFDLQG